jgi:hypothetical protein
MFDVLLRVLLWIFGQCLTHGSRFMPGLRSQITRTLTFELSGGNVVRHWLFDAPSRRVRSVAGPASEPDVRLQFATSWQALAVLVSTRTVDKLVEGRNRGTVEIDGSPLIVLWFYGLTRKFIRLGAERQPREPIPGAYLRHDPRANGAETILIEPAVTRLDPAWRDAWKARSSLLMVRAAIGEPVGEP